MKEALLVLADGEMFEGYAIGAQSNGGVATGEVVFNTALTGYQEILTDPSYAGQIITFTYPHIGNYGINTQDSESSRVFCQGVIVRECTETPSNWRSEKSLSEFLKENGTPGIAGIDTRRLTRHIREVGAIPAAFGTADEKTLRSAAEKAVSTDGIDLVKEVTTAKPYTYGEGEAPFSVVAYDFGMKTTILRRLAGAGCRIEVVPAQTSADDVLARKPDGVFLSNGPGDPAPIAYAVDNIRELLGKVPVFGICLGHQLLGRAIGAQTSKLPFGHHGGNHPVRDERNGKIEITAQNHNYVVNIDTIGDAAKITHVNLNDNTLEGMRLRDVPAFSVQHHPEAGPGPHDGTGLFAEFCGLMVGAR